MCRPSGLEMMMASGPVADATGKEYTALRAGLVCLTGMESC